MPRVEAAKHKVHYTLEELRDDEADLDSECPNRVFPGNPRGTGDFGGRLLTNAARALFFGELALAKRFFAVAVECISAGARAMTAGVGVEIEYEIEGESYEGAADQPLFLAEPGRYLSALAAVIALRASKVADELVAVPIAVIEKAAGRMDPAYLRYVSAWRSFWTKAPDAGALLEQAAALFAPDKLRVADPQSAACHAANIPVMQALLANDEAKVNAGLVGALKAHKAWWGRGTRLSDPDGLIARAPSALASLALQRRMNITVSSPYAPRWLLEGRDPAAEPS